MKKQKATLGNRTKIRTKSRGGQPEAQDCRSQRSTACLLRRMPNAPYPCRLSILPLSKMRRALLAVGSEPGQASKSSASRIRRRSRQHLAEASELNGAMKDRLWRWLTPVVIDRIRRGTHDRADANRTLPEAVQPLSASKQLAARVAGRPMPCLRIGGSP